MFESIPGRRESDPVLDRFELVADVRDELDFMIAVLDLTSPYKDVA